MDVSVKGLLKASTTVLLALEEKYLSFETVPLETRVMFTYSIQSVGLSVFTRIYICILPCKPKEYVWSEEPVRWTIKLNYSLHDV
jgi:hypothetical protein